MIAIAPYQDTHDFEKLYLELRKKEHRIYTDEEVAALPDIAASHPLAAEWQLRKLSCQRLVNYIQKKQSSEAAGKKLKILEIGCGNGWLSYQLSKMPGCSVTGTDINFTELQQGAAVFQDQSNLHFIYSHPRSEIFEKNQFDIIVFAASIQYFPALKEIINSALQLLKEDGEIHILDSHFYPESGLKAARQRSLLYFEAAGFPAMADWYFHHCWEELTRFNYSVLHDPAGFFNRWVKSKNPFPWIRIKH